MLPPGGSAEFQRANALLKLERELFGAWCELTFRPGMGPFGAGAAANFRECLDRVDQALGETDGPWLLGGESPSIVDMQYISHVERMAASVSWLEPRERESRSAPPSRRTGGAYGARRNCVFGGCGLAKTAPEH